jgi:hypothetical protein
MAIMAPNARQWPAGSSRLSKLLLYPNGISLFRTFVSESPERGLPSDRIQKIVSSIESGSASRSISTPITPRYRFFYPKAIYCHRGSFFALPVGNDHA